MQNFRFQRWLPIILLTFVPFAIYAYSLGNGFVVWDDDMLVYKNPLVKHLSLYSIWAVFTSYDPELYIPLTFLSYQIEHVLFGMNAAVFHLSNLLLHIGSSILVYRLLQRWSLTEWVAFAAAFIFAIHPMNSEGVCWVSARKDMLSNFLFLATLLAWESYRSSGNRKRYRSAIALFALALLAKVSVVLLPVILLLMDWREKRVINRTTVREIVPFVVLSAVFIVIALFGKTENIGSLTPLKTLLLASKAIVFYPVTYFAPFSLSSIYHQATPISLARMEFAVPMLLIGLTTLVTIYGLRWSRAPLFSLLFFLVMLAPSFANFSKMGGLYFASDRYIGIAQIGLLYVLAVAWLHLQKSRWHVPVTITTAIVGITVLPAFAFASFERSVLWGDSETLFRDAMDKNPGSPVIHFNLAVVEQERGKYPEALALYDTAIAIRSDYSAPHNNAGVIYREIGDRIKAEEYIRKAIELDPNNLTALINLASILLDRGDADEAIVLLERALADDPYNVPALSKLGAAYGKKEMYKEGLHAFQKAWKLDPVMHEQSKELERILEELEQ